MKSIKLNSLKLFMKGYVLCTLLVAVIFFFVLSVSANAKIDKDELLDFLNHELVVNLVNPPEDLKLTISNGVVTVEGEANTILAKERTVEIIDAFEGVKTVVDEIELATYDHILDSNIRSELIHRLVYDRSVESSNINPAVESGVVTLKGNVDSVIEKEVAHELAKNVKGVQYVNNNLKINLYTNKSDDEIKQEILKSLKKDLHVNDTLIKVSVREGDVKLDGYVDSLKEKDQAVFRSYVLGVNYVDHSNLLVRDYLDRDFLKNKFAYVVDGKLEGVISYGGDSSLNGSDVLKPTLAVTSKMPKINNQKYYGKVWIVPQPI